MSDALQKKPARKSKEPFSLVPFAVQRRLYELVLKATLVRERAGMQDRVHTDYAEIGAIAALNESDLVFPSQHSLGARIMRAQSLADVETEFSQGNYSHALAPVSHGDHTAESLLTKIVGDLIPDSKRMAVVPTLDFAADASWQNVLRFAGRHRLPILFIVPGRIAGKRGSSTDLRTIHPEYGVPVMTVDGSDPIAAYRVATEAAHNARIGRGATVLEAAIVETSNASINSQNPLEHLEDYMRRRGSWDDDWRAEVEAEARESLKTELSA